MLLLVEFYWDCGRAGDLDGLFICEDTDLQKLYGKNIYFGEVLGKHSEISGTLEENDFEIKSSDQEFIAKLQDALNVHRSVSGFNPLNYIDEDELNRTEEEDDEDE